jgi:hypothetical protein
MGAVFDGRNEAGAIVASLGSDGDAGGAQRNAAFDVSTDLSYATSFHGSAYSGFWNTRFYLNA